MAGFKLLLNMSKTYEAGPCKFVTMYDSIIPLNWHSKGWKNARLSNILHFQTVPILT
jgi:hypothetical protein